MNNFLLSLLAVGEIFDAKWETLDDVIAANRLGLPYSGLAKLQQEYGIEKRFMYEIIGLTPKQDERRRAHGQLDTLQSTGLLRLAHICHLGFEVKDFPRIWLKTPLPSLEMTPVDAAQFEASYLQVIFNLLAERPRKRAPGSSSRPAKKTNPTAAPPAAKKPAAPPAKKADKSAKSKVTVPTRKSAKKL